MLDRIAEHRHHVGLRLCLLNIRQSILEIFIGADRTDNSLSQTGSFSIFSSSLIRTSALDVSFINRQLLLNTLAKNFEISDRLLAVSKKPKIWNEVRPGIGLLGSYPVRSEDPIISSDVVVQTF